MTEKCSTRSNSPASYRTEMAPFWNQLDGKSVPVLGLGDGIAHVLKSHLKAKEETEATNDEVQAAA